MPELQEIYTLLNNIASEVAVISVNVRETRTEVSLLTSQVKYLLQLTEDRAMEEKNSNSKDGADALESAYDLLEKSPLSKHPMFKEMMMPLQTMLKKSKA